MSVKREKIHFATVDELLGAPVEKEGTVEIRVDQIFPFENHPFKVVDDDKMDELVESIKANGVMSPVIVRPDDEGTYEMISGHRRLHASQRAGLTTIPAIIKELTDDEATILMVVLSERVLAKYFPPHFTAKEKENVIIGLLEKWVAEGGLTKS